AIKDYNIPVCEHCIEAKTHALPFGNSTTEISDPFHLIHTDLWGPAPVTSRLGFRYFALFIDHHTRFTWIYFLRHKSELLTAAKEFVAMIHTQFGSTIKTFRSDPGGEFTSHALHEFYRSHGILYQQSCPGISEQNGLVERKHRHILELTRALLLQTAVPSHFWVEAVRSVVYLINRQPTPVLQHSSPFEALYHRRPDYTRLRTFGCVCFVLLPRKDRTQLTSKTARCVFLGYTDHHKGYLCYDVVHHRVHIGYHVVFLENLYYFRASTPAATSPSTRLPNFDDHGGDDVVLDDITVPPSPSAGGQQHSPPLIPDSVDPSGPPKVSHLHGSLIILLTPLLRFRFPLLLNRQVDNLNGRRQWQSSYKPFMITQLGILFCDLLMRRSLVPSGYTQPSSTLTVLSTDIRHV
ncbi:Retrovirus-related Pol polyprotein from transposon RE1, partial [Linum perenne]